MKDKIIEALKSFQDIQANLDCDTTIEMIADKIVKSINNNIRSSVRKLNPILRGIVGKKVDIAIRDLQFSNFNFSLKIIQAKGTISAVAIDCTG